MRRKLSTISSDAESARALAIEAERAMRDELGALRDQMTNVSTQLLEEDAENCRIKNEVLIIKLGLCDRQQTVSNNNRKWIWESRSLRDRFYVHFLIGSSAHTSD